MLLIVPGVSHTSACLFFSVPLPGSFLQAGGDAIGEEFRVLSQSDVISFLLKHEGQLGLSLAKR